jgi:reactive chlorine resistance protein C
MNTFAQSAVAPEVERTISVSRPNASRSTFETVGANFTRYGLVIVLLWIGALKFTAAEAAGIQGLVANSPLMAWLYRVFTVQDASNLIGIVEIAVAVLLAVRFLSRRASFIGSIGAILTFAATTTFLFSTPGVLQHGLELSTTGQFLIKDLVLLGGSIWTAADACNACRVR